MTIEDFAHQCLMIKAGNAILSIPCCANCRYYEATRWDNNGASNYVCLHPKRTNWEGNLTKNEDENSWLATKPEDFCSRFEEREKEDGLEN